MNCTNVLGHVNQFAYEVDGVSVFQSYGSVCAVVKNCKVTLGRRWDFSRTTLKHLCAFLNVPSKKDIEKRIKNGDYIVDENLI